MKKVIILVVALSLSGLVANTQKTFYPDGTVKSATSYKNGKKNGIEHNYYPDGATLMFAKPFVNDKLHGIVQAYTKNAILKYEMTYRYGLLDGKSRFYDEKAQLKADIDYSKGFKNGYMSLYYSNGLMMMRTKWKNGELKGGYKYSKDGIKTAFTSKEMKIFSEVNR